MADGPYRVTDVSQTPNAVRVEHSSETVGDKLHCREGNSPDRQLRSRSSGSVVKDVDPLKQPGGWLRSSHPLKKA